MAKSHTWFADRQVEVLVVSFADAAALRAYQERLRWPFMLLADPLRTLYQQLDLVPLSLSQLVGWRTLRSYARSLWSGRGLQYYGKDDVYQAGGDFLIDRHGTVHFAYRSREPGDRPTVAELQNAVENSPSGDSAPDA